MNVPKLRFKEFDGEWEVVTLGEISKLSSSKRIHLSDYVNKGIPFYRGSEISKGGVTGNQELFISRELYEKIKAKYGVPQFNDLLVSAVGTLGNLWKVDEREFYYKDGNLILISDLKADTDYIFSYFSDGFGKSRLIDSAAGSNQKALTMVKMRSVKVPLPSEKEQKKIGEFFGIMDKKLQLQQQKIDLLQEQKKGFLQKMFPKAGETQPEMRFDGFTGDWEVYKWVDTVDISTNMVDPKNVEYDEFLHIGPGNIESFTGRILDNVNTVKEDNLISGKFHFKAGDIIYGKINPQLAKYTLVDFEGLASADAYILNAKNGINQQYLYTILQGEKFYKYSVSVSMRTGMPKINRDELNQYNYLAPNLKEQQKIGEFFKGLDNKIEVQKRKLQLLQKQKQGFMQQMFI